MAVTVVYSVAGIPLDPTQPGPLGATTPSTGSFTTLVASSTITPSQLAGVVGTTTNNSANAGSIGELIAATSGAVGLTSTAVTNGTSISLTAGDWDVSGSSVFVSAAGTIATQQQVGINTVSVTFPASPLYSGLQVTQPAAGTIGLVAPTMRISLTGTTTVYLIIQATFTVSTLTATSNIRARRVR